MESRFPDFLIGTAHAACDERSRRHPPAPEEETAKTGDPCNSDQDCFTLIGKEEFQCVSGICFPKCYQLPASLVIPCGVKETIGVCHPGMQTISCGNNEIVVGDCENEGKPSFEICDGLDNDCDGITDQMTEHDIGDCPIGSAHERICVNGAWSAWSACDMVICKEGENYTVECGSDQGECTPGLKPLWCDAGLFVTDDNACAGSISPTEELCDGKDNDCDAITDEELGTLSCGLGICAKVVDACINGARAVCDSLAEAVEESCNNLDDDCDGNMDNSIESDECDTGLLGICTTGATDCVGGDTFCRQTQLPQRIGSCDGKDWDCDGAIDFALGETVRITPDDVVAHFPSVVWNPLHQEQGIGFYGSTGAGTSTSVFFAVKDALFYPIDLIEIASGMTVCCPALATNGSEYAVCFQNDSDADGNSEIFCSRVDQASRQKIGDPVYIAEGSDVAVAWNGFDLYAVTWAGYHEGGQKIFVSFRDALLEPVIEPFPLTTAASSCCADVDWIDSNKAAVAWVNDTFHTLNFSSVTRDGSKSADIQVNRENSSAWAPDIVADGTDLFVTWWYTGPSGSQIALARFDHSGNGIGSERLFSNDPNAHVFNPSIESNESEIGLVWGAANNGNSVATFARLDKNGARLAEDIFLENTDSSFAGRPAIDWNGSQFGACWESYGYTETSPPDFRIYCAPVGCR